MATLPAANNVPAVAADAGITSLPISASYREPSIWECMGAFIFAAIGTVIGIWTIIEHLAHYVKPVLQRSIVRILVISPLYAVFSWLSLILPAHHVLFDAVRDIWEAIVIYCFLALMLEYAGGEANCANAIQQYPGVLKQLWPLSWLARFTNWRWLPSEITMSPKFLKWCRRAALQFVVIKPVMVFGTIWNALSPPNSHSAWRITEFVVYNICYSIALYALILFYRATRHIPGVQAIRPLPKFLAVKLIIFATYWQSLIILIVAPAMDSNVVMRWNSFILCIETPIAAILQLWAFPAAEFSTEAPTVRRLLLGLIWPAFVPDERHQSPVPRMPVAGAEPVISLRQIELEEEQEDENLSDLETAAGDFKTVTTEEMPPQSKLISTGSQSLSPQTLGTRAGTDQHQRNAGIAGLLPSAAKKRAILGNMKDVLGVADVMEDAVYSFGAKYSKHTQLGYSDDVIPSDR